MIRKNIQKKSVMGPVISVFIMVLVISILAGLTFLLVSELKTEVTTQTLSGQTVTNESAGAINSTGYTLAGASLENARSFSITSARNGTSGLTIATANYTVSSTGVVTNLTSHIWPSVEFDYTYSTTAGSSAYSAVNDTENAGATIVDYLSLIFLALIFGAILTLVLKIIIPYINLGQQMGMGGDY